MITLDYSEMMRSIHLYIAMNWLTLIVVLAYTNHLITKLALTSPILIDTKPKDDDNYNEVFGLNTSEIIRLRGYQATDYYITSEDGYILNLVRARNPLVNYSEAHSKRKIPLLMIHGTGTNANSFVIRSTDIEPKNLAHIDASKLTLESLIEKYENEPASKSLAFTALNFGHEVWFLNRRGTTYSLGHTDKRKKAYYDPFRELLENTGSIVSSMPLMSRRRRKRASTEVFNPAVEEAVLKVLRSSLFPSVDIRPVENFPNKKYWNFSLDEQAIYDLPAAIEFVLDKTNKPKLAALGHSSGSSIILMLLSEKPEYASKISRAILWAPAYDPRSIMSFFRGAVMMPSMVDRIEPASSATVNAITRILSFLICQRKEILTTLCAGLGGFAFGPNGGQTELRAGFYGSVMETVSSHEIASLAQSAVMGRLYHFNHGNKSLNMAAYGQSTPPPYDMSKIALRNIEVWAGNTDHVTSIAGAKKLVRDLGHSTEEHYMDQDGVVFNHVGFIFHRNASRLVTLPCLRSIEMSS